MEVNAEHKEHISAVTGSEGCMSNGHLGKTEERLSAFHSNLIVSKIDSDVQEQIPSVGDLYALCVLREYL